MTTTSAGPPGSSTPTSVRPRIRAGTVVAAPIASSNDTPRACTLRTASIIVSTVPARTPSSRVGGPSATSISTSPS